ncbi:MAG: type II toxin-antitoxin system VapC family toxin [Dehalococcoidia bacterium]|nr:type II toxin-antitoxin system VapC family toxin [Dehalococcoidia bacterium]
MIVPDINLRLYAYNDGSPFYSVARSWWEDLVNGPERIGVPWVVVVGFVRLIINPSAIEFPMSPLEAVDNVRSWFEYPHIVPLNPGPDHLIYFQRNMEVSGIGRNLAPDAHIAALAMERGAEIHSNDSDFGRFPGLRWRNPLESENG